MPWITAKAWADVQARLATLEKAQTVFVPFEYAPVTTFMSRLYRTDRDDQYRPVRDVVAELARRADLRTRPAQAAQPAGLCVRTEQPVTAVGPATNKPRRRKAK